MSEYKTTSPTQVRKNQVITAQLLNNIIDAIVGRIVGGKGVTVRRMSNNIVIESKSIQTGGGVSSSNILSNKIPEPVGIINAAGTSNRASRDDHKHAHEGESIPEVVETLPPIPTTGMKEVYWTSADTGTGDDQVWRAYKGDTEWSPTQRLTDKSGAVV